MIKKYLFPEKCNGGGAGLDNNVCPIVRGNVRWTCEMLVTCPSGQVKKNKPIQKYPKGSL